MPIHSERRALATQGEALHHAICSVLQLQFETIVYYPTVQLTGLPQQLVLPSDWSSTTPCSVCIGLPTSIIPSYSHITSTFLTIIARVALPEAFEFLQSCRGDLKSLVEVTSGCF